MLRLINLTAVFRPKDNALPIALQLAQWVSLMRTHLLTEDEWFYPAMIASGDAAAVATATSFQDDMGHLAEQLEAFDRRWSSSAVIVARFASFRQDMLTLFAAFDRRIERENGTLYRLATATSSAPGSAPAP